MGNGTECPVVFPRGVGVIDWMVPGGAPIAEATSVLMKKYDVAIWPIMELFVVRIPWIRLLVNGYS